MGRIADVWTSFHRFKKRRQIDVMPKRIDAIEKRLAILEAKLADKWPPDMCRACGAQALRMNRSIWVGDGKREVWKCTGCGMEEYRRFGPLPKW